MSKLGVRLEGYVPKGAGGILLPEGLRSFDFCDRQCFVEFMREVLSKENT